MNATGKTASDALRFTLFGFLMMVFIEKIAFDHEKHDDINSQSQSNHTESSVSKGKKTFELNSAMVLCLAMSFHSFFEAAALGLAMDVPSAVMMATSIALHQPAESIALLIAFLKSNMSERSIFLWLMTFSCVGLMGAAAGIFISSIANPYTEAAVVAITAGTFIYVGATEILYEEFEGIEAFEKVKRFASYILGMVSMHFIAEYSSSIGR
eukprot:CAMPEP_0170075434 /NCGR_PEP_ID=MMETSP0019_2-20121128/12569_1 /TAXON_ID=98059 /ORGANISM="Dinobryon sp., Strain UTEXLB2267" /LENGTH=210 /DNA_ID=CAMNT_0010286395 /DNA_START=396 /DNA_END=1028 /DNA_ORIENTATION=+